MPEQRRAKRLSKAHADRAKQFMPFAALKGYYELVAEQERTVQPRRDLSEDHILALSAKLSQVKKGVVIRAIHYEGDAYVKTHGVVTQIEPALHRLTIVKTTIRFEDLLDISGDGIDGESLE